TRSAGSTRRTRGAATGTGWRLRRPSRPCRPLAPRPPHRELTHMIAGLDAQIDTAIAAHAAIRDRLITIPGVGKMTAEVIIAEIGTDMSEFPTAAHLAKW